VRNIKIVLEYDGTDFAGFQSQPRRRTVQKVLEAALSRLFHSRMKIKAASGRTDAGVHAAEQVVNFYTSKTHTLHQIVRGLNTYLPEDVSVQSALEMPADFHARFHAKNKTYQYQIWDGTTRPALERKRVYHVPFRLDMTAMKRGAAVLKGSHDFKSFCSASASSKLRSTVRHIYHLKVLRRKQLIVIQIMADGFLQHMVRNIVGALIEVGRGKITTADLRHILRARDRKHRGMTVPPQGLSLLEVRY